MEHGKKVLDHYMGDSVKYYTGNRVDLFEKLRIA